MNVLHVAYGFLEWSDGVQSETSFAPLVLCEGKIERRRTPEGVEFSISGTGDEPEINAVLAEPRMKARFDDLGCVLIAGSPGEFGKLIAEETEKWGKVVKFSGARVD